MFVTKKEMLSLVMCGGGPSEHPVSLGQIEADRVVHNLMVGEYAPTSNAFVVPAWALQTKVCVNYTARTPDAHAAAVREIVAVLGFEPCCNWGEKLKLEAELAHEKRQEAARLLRDNDLGQFVTEEMEHKEHSRSLCDEAMQRVVSYHSSATMVEANAIVKAYHDAWKF